MSDDFESIGDVFNRTVGRDALGHWPRPNMGRRPDAFDRALAAGVEVTASDGEQYPVIIFDDPIRTQRERLDLGVIYDLPSRWHPIRRWRKQRAVRSVWR